MFPDRGTCHGWLATGVRLKRRRDGSKKPYMPVVVLLTICVPLILTGVLLAWRALGLFRRLETSMLLCWAVLSLAVEVLVMLSFPAICNAVERSVSAARTRLRLVRLRNRSKAKPVQSGSSVQI